MGIDADFEDWWAQYPKKRGKLAAFGAYQRARKHATAAELLEGVAGMRRHMDADPRFRPHPATWLNQGRWEDDYDEPAPDVEVVQSRKDCRHEPRCPSNVWHLVMLDKDAERKQRAG